VGRHNWTLVNGELVSGAYVGTAWRAVPLAEGVVLGVAFGDVFGDVPGEVVAVLPLFPPRPARKTAPAMPRRISTTTATAAGMSHDGRWDGCWSRTGRRGAGGLRAGTGSNGVAGMGTFAAVSAGAGVM
jgi:hypothetical protein